MTSTIPGWWFEPLWKIWKSIGMIIPNIWENKKLATKPPTRIHFGRLPIFLRPRPSCSLAQLEGILSKGRAHGLPGKVLQPMPRPGEGGGFGEWEETLEMVVVWWWLWGDFFNGDFSRWGIYGDFFMVIFHGGVTNWWFQGEIWWWNLMGKQWRIMGYAMTPSGNL